MDAHEYTARTSRGARNVWIVRDPAPGAATAWRMNGARYLRGVPFEIDAGVARSMIVTVTGCRHAAPEELTIDALGKARAAAMAALRAERAVEIDAEFAAGVQMRMVRRTIVAGRLCDRNETLWIRSAETGRRLIKNRCAMRA